MTLEWIAKPSNYGALRNLFYCHPRCTDSDILLFCLLLTNVLGDNTCFPPLVDSPPPPPPPPCDYPSPTEEHEYTLPQEAFPLRHEILDNPSAPEHLQQDKADSPHVSGNEAEATCLTPIESCSLISTSQPLYTPHLPASFFCPVVREMLRYYAEQGDVQMAVSVLIVLGERIRKEIDDLTQVSRRAGGVGGTRVRCLCCGVWTLAGVGQWIKSLAWRKGAGWGF